MKNILFLLILFYAGTVSAQSLSEEYAAIMNDLMYMKYKQKFKYLDKVFKDNPNDPWYYWMKADVYALGENDEETRACYEKAIRLDSTFAAGYGSYARYLLRSDSTSYKKVIELSTKAIQLDPLDYFYVADRANAYLEMKDYTNAIADAQFFTKHTDEFSFEGNLVLLHCYIEMNEPAKLKELLMLSLIHI
jgi:tetratricopeptide (TPR) repeat protein